LNLERKLTNIICVATGGGMEIEMIPKIIHYCWFGGKELPELAKKCMETWERECSDYKIMRWDENTFDIANSLPYVKEAYENKKYAFVSDYVRLWAIYNYGGVYMDTDVEVCKSIDGFLEEHAFSGFESYTDVPTGIMAGEKDSPIFKELLDYYNDKHFVKENGEFDLTTNVTIFTNIFEQKGLLRNNTQQTIAGFTFFPKGYFCPGDHDRLHRKDQVYTVHHFAGSWLPEEEIRKRNSFSYKLKWKIIRTARKVMIAVLGEKKFDKLRGRDNQ
jgi:hypothetical protein